MFHLLDSSKILFDLILGGRVKPGMKIKFCCSGYANKSLKNLSEAKARDYVGISFTEESLKEASFNVFKKAKYGVMLADANNMPRRVQSFEASFIFVSTILCKQLWPKFIVRMSALPPSRSNRDPLTIFTSDILPNLLCSAVPPI